MIHVLLLLLAQTAGASAHIGNATRLMQDRLYSEAAVEFEKALEADPDNDALRLQYATCLFVQERNDEARKQFDIERKRLGEKPGLTYFLGQLDLRAGNSAEAIRELQPLESNPAFPKAAFYLGLAYLSAGQDARALERLKHAAVNDPRDPDIHYRLGRVYSLAGRVGDAEREYKLYREAREDQALAETDGRACMDALRSQPIDNARGICNRIARPDDPRRLVFLGQLYVGAGAFSDAVGPLRQAAALDAKSFDAWHYLGVSLFRLHRYREAVTPLQKAAVLNPQFFETWNVLAKAFHLLGNDDAALPALEKAHNLNPVDAGVTQALEGMRAAARAKSGSAKP